MLLHDHPARSETRVRPPAKRHLPFGRAARLSPNWILVGIGAVLVLVSLRGPLLIVGGQSAEARVTSVTETTAVGEYPQPSTIVGYTFAAQNGGSYHGTFSLTPPMSTSLPRVGDPVPVRYLPSFPGLHTADSVGELTGLAIVSFIAGALLVFFGFKRSSS